MKTPTNFANENWCITGLFATALLLLSISGCATFRPSVLVTNEPEYIAELSTVNRPRLALVLSGGSLRGFAHIGVIKVLEENGIRPDIVVGSSAGALIGALYASGLSSSELEEVSRRMGKSLASDVTMPSLGIPWLSGELGVVRGEALQNFVNAAVRQRPIESFPIRFAAVATDLNSGKAMKFNVGNAGMATRASSSIPGMFTPPMIRGHRYIDGQLTSPVPVSAALELGAEIVIAVDVTYPPEHAEITTPISVMFQALQISAQQLKESELKLAHLVIRPEIKPVSQLSLSDREDLIRIGEQAARDSLHGATTENGQ